MNVPRVVLWTPLGSQRQMLAAALREEPGVELLVAESEAEAIAAMARADAALLAGVAAACTPAIMQAVQAAPGLRWLQLISTGYEGLETQGGLPAQVTITGVGASSAPVVAEHAMALLLALARGLAGVGRGPARRKQGSRAPRVLSLEGRTLCLAGYGHIGKEIARRALAFGMRCIAVNRSGQNDAPTLAQEVFTMDRLHEALALSDAVAISLPGSPSTASLFGAREWAACRIGAWVVNVGRGTVVDTDSLVAALHDGQIAGAGLDVTEPEPLPDDHPLWTAPGALISPHVGGAGSAEGAKRLVALLRENLRRFRSGEPLAHVVDIRT